MRGRMFFWSFLRFAKGEDFFGGEIHHTKDFGIASAGVRMTPNTSISVKSLLPRNVGGPSLYFCRS